MILQINSISYDEPRISLNQLSEFPFASPRKKIEILYDQKYGNSFRAPYYTLALAACLRSFHDGKFDKQMLSDEAEKISLLTAKNRQQETKHANNVLAVQKLLEIGADADPLPGKHRLIRQNAWFRLNGVVISARPEIVTDNIQSGHFAFTKLRFSKSKVSADAQEIALLVLLYYGQQQDHDDLIFSIEKSKLVDCFSKSVIHGHSLTRFRYQQLQEALAEICILWPQIAHKNEIG